MNLYDLALCIDNNDNRMTFVGHMVCLCPSWHHLHPCASRLGANDATQATGELYALQRSCDCPIVA